MNEFCFTRVCVKNQAAFCIEDRDLMDRPRLAGQNPGEADKGIVDLNIIVCKQRLTFVLFCSCFPLAHEVRDIIMVLWDKVHFRIFSCSVILHRPLPLGPPL